MRTAESETMRRRERERARASAAEKSRNQRKGGKRRRCGGRDANEGTDEVIKEDGVRINEREGAKQSTRH